MSDSLGLHGLWPTRLPCSWDFPGKNISWNVPFPPPGESCWPRDPTVSLGSPALADGSLPLCDPVLNTDNRTDTFATSCDYQIILHIKMVKTESHLLTIKTILIITTFTFFHQISLTIYPIWHMTQTTEDIMGTRWTWTLLSWRPEMSPFSKDVYKSCCEFKLSWFYQGSISFGLF